MHEKLEDHLLANATFVIVLMLCLGVLLSTVPFLLLFTLGKRLRVLGLPYSLMSGILLCEWALQFFVRMNWLIGGPDDPFTREWSTSPSMNGSMLLGGLLGGGVFWWAGLRTPQASHRHS